ncbi:MAG: Gfo/Idh/MocA family oxidoreductase [Treponema sp.]|jgi:predicted dehydrogenase|nr:Gfo/Idh/MocA family oxidoreductase [Treponema sp.]
MVKRFRAGVIGAGFIGAVHIEQLRRLGNVEVAALVKTAGLRERAEALGVPAGYTDYREMIDRESLDAVHICTPNSTHFEMAMYALEKGLHVICEKPMTCTAGEAEELCRKAREKGLVNAINFNCRFYPMVYQIREMAKAGELGDIFTVHGSYLQDWLYLDTDYSWRLEPELSGESRAFADIGSHWIDLVQFVTGLRVTGVLADFAVFHKNRKKPLKPVDTYSGMALRPEDYEATPVKTEDYAAVLFCLENGARGCCAVSQVFAGRKNQMVVEIGGSKCAVRWDSENSNALWIGRRGSANGELVKDPSILSAATAGITSYPGGHVEGFPDTFKQNFRKVYDAMAGGVPSSPDYATFEDGLREVILNDRIVQSARERRWADL